MNYDGSRLCGVDDRQGIGESRCRWPLPDITWALKADLPPFPRSSLVGAIEQAWKYWADVCGIRPRMVSTAANIEIGIQTISPGGVLADCELPCAVNMRQSCRMRIDTAEAWVIAQNPPANKVDLVRVICHELGHGLGCPHLSGPNLMAPTYSRDIRQPQRDDIAWMVGTYGLPTAPVPEPVPPTTEGIKELVSFLTDSSGRLLVRVNGTLFGQVQ